MARKSDNDHDNDNGKPEREERALAPAPERGALISLEALGAALNNVDTASVVGRTGLPMLQFKREGGGVWSFGQRSTVVEEGSRWALNPRTYKRGFICFNDNHKVLDEQLAAIDKPMPSIKDLPDTGAKWQEEWCVNMKCLDGADAGVEVIYKPTTDGGIKAVVGSVELVRDRLNGGQHDGNIVPIMRLEKDSYLHPKHGRVWTPVLTDVGWMSLEGPAPAPASPPPPPPSTPPTATPAGEQPRRRRVA